MSNVLSDILLNRGFTAAPTSKVAAALKRQGVPASLELDRIVGLPRRPVDLASVPNITPVWARPEGKLQLWPIQCWALLEAERAGGIFGAIACGAGKTLISILMVDALASKKAVLLIPPQLRNQLLYRDIPFYNKHFDLDSILPRLKIIAYSELSSPKKAEILEEIKPDLIIADECHNLRDRGSARTRRFMRAFKDNPSTRFVGLSGTVTRRSILDYVHLLEFSLKGNSPLPRGFRERKDWAAALDVSDDPMPPGQLTVFVDSSKDLKPEEGDTLESQQVVRRAFRRRLVETIGVVSTSEDSLGTSLIIQARYPQVPQHIALRLKLLRESWQHEGEELPDPMAVYRIIREVSSGFYYKWDWPDGVPDMEWLTARANWHREVRSIVQRNKKGLDSMFLVATAAADGRIRSEHWAAWALVKERYKPHPPILTIWLDDFLVDECGKWMEEIKATEHSGIIWSEHSAFGKALAKKMNLPYYGEGAEASKALTTIDAKEQRVIVCSIHAHGDGKNLQAYSRLLYPFIPSSAKIWEQSTSRVHRPGQEADEVIVDAFMHTEESKSAFQQAVQEAMYVQQTQGAPQKLLIANRIMK